MRTLLNNTVLFSRKTGNDSGVILIVVLWLVVILTLVALGLGQRARLDLCLTKYLNSKLCSKYAVIAGLVYAQEQIRQYTLMDKDDLKDRYLIGGIRPRDEQWAEKIFHRVALKDGYFDISYKTDNHGKTESHYGIIDEERKININALSSNNYLVLKYLLQELNVDEHLAGIISAATVDWHDEDLEPVSSDYGAENDYYQNLSEPYACKNTPFDSIEELLLVRGVTAEILEKIRPYITIFPQTGRLRINFNTASKPVLLSLAKNFTGPMTNTSLEDAESLVEKILSYRAGPDGIEGTSDDRALDMKEIPLTSKERAIFLTMIPHEAKETNYLRVEIDGHDLNSTIKTHAEAVIARNDLSIMYWHRD